MHVNEKQPIQTNLFMYKSIFITILCEKNYVERIILNWLSLSNTQNLLHFIIIFYHVSERALVSLNVQAFKTNSFANLILYQS